MLLKSRYLIIAISYVIICLIDSYKYRVITGILLSIIFRYFFDEKKSVIYELAILLIIALSFPVNTEYFSKGHVCQIKNKYCVVSNKINSVIVYNLDAMLDDEVIINSEIKPISSNSNFEMSTFETYCRGNNIIGTINSDKVKVNKNGNSIRKFFFTRNEKLGNDWANLLIFNKGIEIENDNKYLIMSSGMHISFFIYFIKSIFEKFFYPKRTMQITIMFSALLTFLFHFSYGFTRVTVALIVDYLIEDRRDKVAIFVIVMCLFKPYYVKSISFLIPAGIKIINLFRNESKIIIPVYISTIQLMFYGKINIINSFSFSLLRLISGYLYSLAIIVSLLPIKIPLNNLVLKYVNIVGKIISIELKGAPSLIGVFVILILIEKYNINNKKRYIVALLLLLVLNHNKRQLIPIYSITFLDVGQGDCALITIPFSNEALLIDTGGSLYKDVSKDITSKYLDKEGLGSLCVIITHDDYDHSGGLKSLKELYDIKKIYREKQEVIYFHHLQIFNPLFFMEYDDVNSNSLISYFNIGGFDFLFAADIDAKVESDIIDNYSKLNIDILKLSHHGSATGNSDKLFRNTNIIYGIISVGKNNKYGHPSIEVIERLKKYDIKYLTTADNGAIKFYCFRNLLFYKTSRGQFGFVYK